MKGFVTGVKLGIFGIVCLIGEGFSWITFKLCCDTVAVTALVVLFVHGLPGPLRALHTT